nr:MAG TPA: hypothetical protein [Bacteriophage sp.]
MTPWRIAIATRQDGSLTVFLQVHNIRHYERR